MTATTILPVTSLLYNVGLQDTLGVVLAATATTVNEVGTVTSLVTSSLVSVGTGLWIDQELFKVVEVASHPTGFRYKCLRGQGGSMVQSHSSTTPVTIGSMDKFYKYDPKGRPRDVMLVTPWINTVSGRVWQPQGDSYPGAPVRWWQEVTNTYGIGALGIPTRVSTPGFGT